LTWLVQKAIGPGACVHGVNCTTISCQHEHPPGRRRPCRNASGCTRPECPFLHPPKKRQCWWEHASPTGVCWHRATKRECLYAHQLSDEDYEFLVQENKGKCCHGPSMICKRFRRPCRLADEQHCNFSPALQKRFPLFGPPQQCQLEEASPAKVCWRRVGEMLCGSLHTRSDDDYAFITKHTKNKDKCYHGPSLRCKPRCARPQEDHCGYSAELCARFPVYEEKEDKVESVNPPAEPHPNVPHPNVHTTNGEENTADEEDEQNCCICLDKQKTHIVLDCMHLCLCGDCSEGLKICPFCRAPARDIKRVYM